MAKHAATVETVAHPVGEASAHAVSFWQEPDTWILVGFLLFVALFVKWVLPTITKALDGRAHTIRDQLEQANRLRAEAQALLETYRQQQQEMMQEAESIVANAKRDAEAMRASAAAELKESLARRTEQAREKIARAEAEALAGLQRTMVDLATQKVEATLAAKADAAVDERAAAAAIVQIKRVANR